MSTRHAQKQTMGCLPPKVQQRGHEVVAIPAGPQTCLAYRLTAFLEPWRPVRAKQVASWRPIASDALQRET